MVCLNRKFIFSQRQAIEYLVPKPFTRQNERDPAILASNQPGPGLLGYAKCFISMSMSKEIHQSTGHVNLQRLKLSKRHWSRLYYLCI